MGDKPISFESAVATAGAVGIGLIPGAGSAQNDTYPYVDNIAVGFPLNCDYVIPANFQRLLSAKLSIKLRAFRTYNSFSATATGAGTAHLHGHSVTHSHSHNHGSHQHNISIAPGGGGNALSFVSVSTPQISQVGISGGTDTTSIVLTTPSTDATVTAPGNTDNEATHTHPVSITSTLGIFEGAVATAVTITNDGVDRTTILGGPWSTDQVEIDIAKVLPITTKAFHTIALVGSGLGRIEALLRLSYYANAQVQA